MSDPKSEFDAANAEQTAAMAALADAEENIKAAQAEFEEAGKLAPSLTQTDLARTIQRESLARAQGLI
jgi:hypothetical protein